ncbi:hypothetical protein [Sulfurimonas sp.]|uniref:hypothetical protein n=1 Tax=Sulfurimonas sp. TaxID=2022749 RepID=UPI0025E589BE|nr:hypothetical protein [Sulfurimonas sp.]
MSIGIDLERFEHFKDSEFRSLEILSPGQLKITFTVQDKAREFDWITLSLEFSGVTDAKLHEESKMKLINLSDGINIIKTNTGFAFGIGECYNISNIQSSVCYILYRSLKYEEGLF